MVAKGEMAPDFEATSTGGQKIRLSDYRGKKNVVIFFYPGDFTPVCTVEACAFRDAYETLASGDTEVIGISSDDDDSHRKFAAKHSLPYPLISDPKRELANKFGASGVLFKLLDRTKRLTVVIDKQGRVVDLLTSQLSGHSHVEGARKALAQLA